MNRIKIRVVGHSGYGGLLSTGSIIAKSLEALGFYVVTDREYPSLIKGGTSSMTINASIKPIKSLAKKTDILIAIDKPSLLQYIDTLSDGGVLIHGYEKLSGIREVLDATEKRGIKIIHQNARTTTKEAGGSELMKNVVLVGMLWKALDLPLEIIKDHIENQFKKKPKLIPANLECVRLGYERSENQISVTLPKEKHTDYMFVDGNYAMTLGAIHAGVKVYYAYPMSPSSHILSHMARFAKDYDLVVKQAEDEITVANLTVGSMHAGTRALCATSGGGFDLMTETVSLAGIIECPFICALFQRPGPATGLPTWTGQGDLNLAIHGGHGEFARMVLAVSDPSDHFTLIQEALNYAEVYQIPVIILSDKVSAETYMSVPKFKQNTIPIQRGLVEDETELKNLKNTDRFKITESGLSKRWIPGSSEAYYFANGDEHKEDGVLDESETAGIMYEKRIKKLKTILEKLPEPEIIGNEKNAEISFVGWGSTKCTAEDIINIYKEKNITVNYLHFSYVYPLKTEKLKQFFADNKNVHLLEGNNFGQLGNLIMQETNLTFKGKCLKWDGRPFFIEDLENYIDQNI